jgi:hypothetical protein
MYNYINDSQLQLYTKNMRQSELRVTDWFYEDIGFASNICLNWITIAVMHFKKALKTIAEEVVSSGSTHDALVEYVSIYEELGDIMKDMGDQYRSLCNTYVSDVNDWDQFVYQASKTARIIRDFSDDKYYSIKGYLKTTPPGGLKVVTNVLSWAVGTPVRGVQEIGNLIDESKRCRSSYIANLANRKDCDAQELKAIFDRVKNCDSAYAQKFGALYDELYEAYSILCRTNEVFEKKTAFNPSTINDLHIQIEGIKRIKEVTDRKLNIVSNVNPTIEQITDFVDDFRNEHFFLNLSPELNRFVGEISTGDAILMALFNGDNIIATHYGTITIPPEVPKKKRYEYVMLKKQLAEIIADVADSEIEISTEAYETAKTIFSTLKDGKKLASDYEVYKGIYDKVCDTFGAVADGLDVGVDVAEIFIHICADYTENQNVIASLAANATEGSLLSIAVAQLQEEYKDAYLRGVVEFCDFAFPKLTKAVIKGGTKEILALAGGSAGGLYSLASFGIKTVGTITGATKHVSSKVEFCTLYNSLSDIEHAYKENFANVKAGNTSEQDILNLQNSFEVMKRSYAKLYKLMGDSVGASGDINRQAYYQYVSRSLEKASISNGISEIVSYETFLSGKFTV